MAELLDELTLKEKEHVIFVVNDHDDPSRSGGSHWSLLICRRDLRPHFLIIDSAQGTSSANRKPTDKVCICRNCKRRLLNTNYVLA